jgi:hypothetical protein
LFVFLLIASAGCFLSFIPSTYSFLSRSMVKRHPCEHEGCTRSFTTTTNLKNHTRIHTGERPFERHSPSDIRVAHQIRGARVPSTPSYCVAFAACPFRWFACAFKDSSSHHLLPTSFSPPFPRNIDPLSLCPGDHPQNKHFSVPQNFAVVAIPALVAEWTFFFIDLNPQQSNKNNKKKRN